MNLSYHQSGNGQALIILHGLFGSSDNWRSIGNELSRFYEVYLIDLRNHGRSPHFVEFSYTSMANDIAEFISEKKLNNPILMGHSMGGKVAMTYALNYPEKIEKLIIVDIAPKYYAPHHQKYIDAFNSIDLKTVSTRKEVEEHFTRQVSDIGERQLLLKNLYWNENERLAWRVNIDAISKHIDEMCEAQDSSKMCNKPCLFIRGEKSKYITNEDAALIQQIFPNSKIETIPNAGHWVHAEKTQDFLTCVLHFLKQ